MRPALAPAAALLCAACSYDLDVLRGRDAGPDARRPDASGDVAQPDVAPPDAPADRPAPDAPAPDVPPPRDASMGACANHEMIALSSATAGVVSADGVLTVVGNTTGGEAAVPGCPNTTPTPMSTRVYRYVVQSGPRLVATTNTGLCGAGTSAAHDTILAAYFNCGVGGLVPGPRSCIDDDGANVCEGMACAGENGLGCGTVFSTLELGGLTRGDVVYLAVSGYPAMTGPQRGPFRLSVAENGLSPAAPPTTGSPAAANRCTCPAATTPPAMWATRAINFPRDPVQNQLGTPMSRSVFARQAVGLTQVWGVSGSFRLSQFNVATAPPCGVSGGATAALDIILGTAVVASVSLGVYVGEAGTVTIPFTTFAPLTFAAGADPLFQYRIRNVQPADSTCVTLNIDTAAPNTLTLYGAM